VEVVSLDVAPANDEGWCQDASYEGGFVWCRVEHENAV